MTCALSLALSLALACTLTFSVCLSLPLAPYYPKCVAVCYPKDHEAEQEQYEIVLKFVACVLQVCCMGMLQCVAVCYPEHHEAEQEQPQTTLQFQLKLQSLLTSWHTHEWVKAHTHAWIVSHIWKSHTISTLASIATHGWATACTCTSHGTHTWMSLVTHIYESRHTYEWIMSHMWINHVTHMNEACNCNPSQLLRLSHLQAPWIARSLFEEGPYLCRVPLQKGLKCTAVTSAVALTHVMAHACERVIQYADVCKYM